MLGLSISERTVSSISLASGHTPVRSSVGCSFSATTGRDRGDGLLTVPTATFRILYVWFAIDHAKRRVLHFDVTDRPAAAWVVQQLRESVSLMIPPCAI